MLPTDPGWKAFADKFAMPKVSPIATHAVCVNCGKPAFAGRLYNADELKSLDGLRCGECS